MNQTAPKPFNEDRATLQTLTVVLIMLPRPELESIIEMLIRHLDFSDGDPDFEATGDERDTSNAEDELTYRPMGWRNVQHAGCSIADAG
ncbi:MAG: hypothetical protein AAGL10_15340 [Pseudomonadota bacterium]